MPEPHLRPAARRRSCPAESWTFRPVYYRAGAIPLSQGFHPRSVQRPVAAAALAQLRGWAVLDHPPAVDHEHPVGDLDRRQAVGDFRLRLTASETAAVPFFAGARALQCPGHFLVRFLARQKYTIPSAPKPK